ncbi:YhjD/YihY/BrkB family envelope integrity protein [Nocardioides conyzicola]
MRERLTATYQLRKEQAQALVDRVPILGRLIRDFVKIEFIDRCMLIAAQGLLALIPMLVVLTAFFPHATSDLVRSFSQASGVGQDGTRLLEGEVTSGQVRTQTGVFGFLITLFSATSFARAIQRMYERIWDQPHVGGLSGAQRCLLWLLGWMLTLQIIGALRRIGDGVGGILGDSVGFVVQAALLSMLWWATSWVLLFGRVPWRALALGAVLTGVLGIVYNRGASFLMPPYVRANAEQFGTLGVILAVSTWLIGFAAIMVGSALVGRIVSEDPTVVRLATRTVDLTRPVWGRLRRRPADGTAPRPRAG